MAIFVHWKCSGEVSDKTGVPGGYRNPPGVIGPHGPKWWKRRGGQEVARGPPCPTPNWEREGGVAPFSFLLSTSSFPLLLVGIGFAEGGKEREGPAPSPCPIRTKGGEGRAAHVGLTLLFSTKAHYGPYSSRGGVR